MIELCLYTTVWLGANTQIRLIVRLITVKLFTTTFVIFIFACHHKRYLEGSDCAQFRRAKWDQTLTWKSLNEMMSIPLHIKQNPPPTPPFLSRTFLLRSTWNQLLQAKKQWGRTRLVPSYREPACNRLTWKLTVVLTFKNLTFWVLAIFFSVGLDYSKKVHLPFTRKFSIVSKFKNTVNILRHNTYQVT